MASFPSDARAGETVPPPGAAVFAAPEPNDQPADGQESDGHGYRVEKEAAEATENTPAVQVEEYALHGHSAAAIGRSEGGELVAGEPLQVLQLLVVAGEVVAERPGVEAQHQGRRKRPRL